MTGFDFTDVEEDAPDYVPESECHVCDAIFGPQDTGHCSPITGGCCQTFASNHAFDRHMVGPFNPDGLRRCLTVAELEAKGWTKTGPYQSWRTPPPKTSPWTKENA